MTNDELLLRIAQTLKQEIGPAVTAEYPKTQAFMAAVVLEKVSRELATERVHAAAQASGIAALLTDLDRAASAMPAAVRDAIAQLRNAGDDAALVALIAALYAARAELDATRFDALLRRIRQTLRASIDRRMEYAA